MFVTGLGRKSLSFAVIHQTLLAVDALICLSLQCDFHVIFGVIVAVFDREYLRCKFPSDFTGWA